MRIVAAFIALALSTFANAIPIQVKGVFSSDILSGSFASMYDSEDVTTGTGVLTVPLQSLTVISSLFTPTTFNTTNSAMGVIFDNRPTVMGESVREIVIGANIPDSISSSDPSITNDFRVGYCIAVIQCGSFSNPSNTSGGLIFIDLKLGQNFMSAKNEFGLLVRKPAVTIPEPDALGLIGIAVGLVLIWRRQRRLTSREARED